MFKIIYSNLLLSLGIPKLDQCQFSYVLFNVEDVNVRCLQHSPPSLSVASTTNFVFRC